MKVDIACLGVQFCCTLDVPTDVPSDPGAEPTSEWRRIVTLGDATKCLVEDSLDFIVRRCRLPTLARRPLTPVLSVAPLFRAPSATRW